MWPMIELCRDVMQHVTNYPTASPIVIDTDMRMSMKLTLRERGRIRLLSAPADAIPRPNGTVKVIFGLPVIKIPSRTLASMIRFK